MKVFMWLVMCMGIVEAAEPIDMIRDSSLPRLSSFVEEMGGCFARSCSVSSGVFRVTSFGSMLSDRNYSHDSLSGADSISHIPERNYSLDSLGSVENIFHISEESDDEPRFLVGDNNILTSLKSLLCIEEVRSVIAELDPCHYTSRECDVYDTLRHILFTHMYHLSSVLLSGLKLGKLESLSINILEQKKDPAFLNCVCVAQKIGHNYFMEILLPQNCEGRCQGMFLNIIDKLKKEESCWAKVFSLVLFHHAAARISYGDSLWDLSLLSEKPYTIAELKGAFKER